MPENILEKIIKNKIEKIENSKKNISLDSLKELIEFYSESPFKKMKDGRSSTQIV